MCGRSLCSRGLWVHSGVGFLTEVRFVFQGRGAAVPAPQTKTKPPREEDFENIKLISNGAYGYEALLSQSALRFSLLVSCLCPSL